MRRGAVFLFILLVVSTSAYKQIKSSAPTFYEGRSGQIVLNPDVRVTDEALLLSSRLFGGSSSHLKAEVVDLAPLFAEAFGIMSFFPSSPLSSRFPDVSANLFEKPRGGVMFYVPGFLPHAAEEGPIRSWLNIGNSLSFKKTKNVPLLTSSSRLASLVTGVLPKYHGVVAEEVLLGDGSVQRSSVLSATIADLFVATFGKDSKVVSASGSEYLARIGGVSDVSSNMDMSNVHVESWDVVNRRPSPLSGGESVFSGHFPFRVGVFEVSEASEVYSVVNSATGKVFSFPATDCVSNFFGELSMLVEIPSMFESGLSEAAPSLTVFSVSGLDSSLEDFIPMGLATSLVDAAISEACTNLEKATEGRLLAAVVVGPRTARLGKPDVDALRKKLDGRLLNARYLEPMIPNIYVRSAVDVKQACRDVEEVIDFQVHCFVARSPYVGYSMPFLGNASSNASSSSNFSNSSSNGSSTPYTLQDVETYQIVLWLSIALVLIALFSVLNIAYMKVDKDSLIYRMTYQKQKKL